MFTKQMHKKVLLMYSVNNIIIFLIDFNVGGTIMHLADFNLG